MNIATGICATAAALALSISGAAQTSAGGQKPMPSPPATADVSLDGKQITLTYNAPSMRGRTIFGGLVPYGQVWRTGANAATTLKTAASLTVGSAHVPAGTYTLYTLPAQNDWKLIISKQTGQWGTEYHQDRDLARIDMHTRTLPQPQEKMSISFENTHGASTELHIRWETTDAWVPVSAQ